LTNASGCIGVDRIGSDGGGLLQFGGLCIIVRGCRGRTLVEMSLGRAVF
jgi:hypothetical protein